MSGCRAGWLAGREMRAIPDATIWALAKAQVDLLPDTVLCCATTEMQPILYCSSGEASNLSQGLRACRAGRCAAGVRGTGGLDRDVVG